MQVVGRLRGQRPETETYFGRWRDDIGLDAALDLADIETQAGQSAESLVRLRFDQIECPAPPSHRLMQRAGLQRLRA